MCASCRPSSPCLFAICRLQDDDESAAAASGFWMLLPLPPPLCAAAELLPPAVVLMTRGGGVQEEEGDDDDDDDAGEEDEFPEVGRNVVGANGGVPAQHSPAQSGVCCFDTRQQVHSIAATPDPP